MSGGMTKLDRRSLHYGRQHIDEDDIAAVVEVLKSDFLTQGPAVEHFEKEFAARVGANHAIAVSSGTAALHVACLAAGIGNRNVGVTSTLTFAATANAVLYCGGDVILCDVDRYGLCLAPDALRRALDQQPDTTAVLTVDFGGLAHNAAEIRAVAGDRIVIEDAAHALGGSYDDGRPIGCCAWSDMTVFSFHPVKSITCGEGGMITTNDDELARRARLFRNHGIERQPERFKTTVPPAAPDEIGPWYYEQQVLGFNYRLSDIHAALGLSQLGKLGRFVARRRAIAAHYDSAFEDVPGLALHQSRPADRARSAMHLYIVELDYALLGTTRTDFMRALQQRRIKGQVHYIPVHRHPLYRERYRYDPASFPRTEAYYAGCLSLPLHADMSDEETEYVISSVIKTIEQCGSSR